VVDWSRRPFDCDAQPFADSSQVVRVRFYPAAPGAKAIPFPSNIYVPDWDFDKEWWEPPGTVPAEWPGNPYNRAKSVPGSGAGHVCGTEEQFAGEAPLDPDADMQYRPDGLPVCCDPREELAGGAGGAPVDGVSVTSGPGDACGLGQTLHPGDTVSGSLHLAPPLSAEVNWWVLSGTPGVQYRCRVTAHTGDDVAFAAWTSCVSGLLGGHTVTHGTPTGCFDFVMPPGGVAYLDAAFLYTGFSTTAAYTLAYAAGACP
jgi:hypothetical protein